MVADGKLLYYYHVSQEILLELLPTTPVVQKQLYRPALILKRIIFFSYVYVFLYEMFIFL